MFRNRAHRCVSGWRATPPWVASRCAPRTRRLLQMSSRTKEEQMKRNEDPSFRRGSWAVTVVLVVALAGMGYCHIKDVGMKFDEHVYYMAYLFSANIAASFALAAFVVACRLFGEVRWFRRTLLATLGLALSTIAGFIWSRTVGFPQMDDHIGQWDVLGLTSLAFEGAAALVAAACLVVQRSGARQRVATTSRARIAATAAGLLVVVALASVAGP